MQNHAATTRVEKLDHTREDYTVSKAAKKLIEDTRVFDTLALRYVLDEPFCTQYHAAGVKAFNVTIVGEASWDETLRALEEALQEIEKSPILKLALSAADVLSAQDHGYLAVVPVTQGAGMIGQDLLRLSLLCRMGIRSIGLSYTSANDYADGCGEARDAGLTLLGREFISAVNELPLMLDLSHVGHKSRVEATELANWPVCTHANAFSLVSNDRNVKDEVARSIVAKGGMVSACALPKTVCAENPTLQNMINHIEFFANLLGEENIGIGFDFSTGLKTPGKMPAASRRWRTLRPDIFGSVEDFFATSYPEGIEDITDLANVAQALLDRNWPETSIKGVLGENWINVMRRSIDERH